MEDIILSIGIASYNRKEWLCKNIDNLLQYSGQDIEIIVCDNASDDGTWDRLQEYNDKRLKIIRNNTNCGAGYNAMKSLVLGIGKYGVAINDRDTLDVSLLHDFIKVLENSKSEVIAASPFLQRYSNKFNDITIRCTCWNFVTHPGTYYISRTVINQIKDMFNIKLEYISKRERDEYMNMARVKYQQKLINAGKWEWYGRTIIKITDRSKEGIKQTREEKIPWFYPEFSFQQLRDLLLYCENDVENSICGLYRAGLLKCLYFFYTRDPQKRSWEKLAVKFYKDSINELISLERFTKQIGRRILRITLSECCTFALRQFWAKLVSIKMKFIKRPILKKKC